MALLRPRAASPLLALIAAAFAFTAEGARAQDTDPFALPSGMTVKAVEEAPGPGLSEIEIDGSLRKRLAGSFGSVPARNSARSLAPSLSLSVLGLSQPSTVLPKCALCQSSGSPSPLTSAPQVVPVAMGDISERAVRYRIDRMIDEGVIQISAVVSPEALGLTIKADVWLEVESDLILEVAKKMAAFENVTYVACGIGQNDISIQIVAKDTAEIYYFVTEVIRKVTGVRKTTTSIVPIIIKDVYQWRVPERIAKEIVEGKTAV